MRKIQFGCGSNLIEGWLNHDLEVDITRPLPYSDNYADAVFSEHCIEHVTPQQAYSFFEECHRILKPSGLIRISVPSIERVNQLSNRAYEDFCHQRGWAENSSRAKAIKSLIFCHGHQAIWSASLLKICLECSGFSEVEEAKVTHSRHEILQATNGHGRVIGYEFNWIETITVEGRK